MNSKLIIGLVIIIVIVAGIFVYTNIKPEYDKICPWDSVEDCKFAILNIIPLCDNIKEVEEWKQQYPAASKPFGYTIRKHKPDEINQMVSQYPNIYGKLLGINQTENIWWTVDYLHVERGASTIPEHPRLTIYINERTKNCIPWSRFQ